MNVNNYQYFVCPNCASDLELNCENHGPDNSVIRGNLWCRKCNGVYSIVNGIPRFVHNQNYASSFGIEWRLHSRTQIDKFNGTTISRDRFYKETRWAPSELRGKKVLECGSGAGRFTQVILDARATCFSFDYSDAVEVNLENNSPNDNLILAQADIYHIPFKKRTFDYIFCRGVLQHTPDARKAFLSMIPYLKDAGEIVVDVYSRSFKTFIHPKRILRLATTRMNKEKLYKIIKITAPYLLSLSCAVKKIPLLGEFMSTFIPIANYKNIHPIPDEQLLDWAILDTFDWLSPTYDYPQTKSSLKRYFQEAGLIDIDIDYMVNLKEERKAPFFKYGALVGKGKKLYLEDIYK